MLDFNGIGIKCAEDLQDALSIEHDAESFKQQFLWMVERWGLDDSLSMLSFALCGSKDSVFPIKPLIHFTKRMIPKGPPNDPWETYSLENIKKT